jgi:hypothetical protein
VVFWGRTWETQVFAGGYLGATWDARVLNCVYLEGSQGSTDLGWLVLDGPHGKHPSRLLGIWGVCVGITGVGWRVFGDMAWESQSWLMSIRWVHMGSAVLASGSLRGPRWEGGRALSCW